MKSQLYYKTCQILDKLNNKKATFKTTVFSIIGPEDLYFKKIYCLAAEITKTNNILDEIIQKEFSNDEITQYNISNSMLKVLLFEIYLSEHKFKQGGRLIKFIKSKGKNIQQIIKNSDFQQSKVSLVNQNNLYFRVLSYRIKNEEESQSLKDTLKEIANKDEYIKDLYCLKNISYDSEKEKLFSLRDNNLIKIQSKSSCLPAYLLYRSIKKGLVDSLYLDNESKTNIIDSCAAPGNKTLQLCDLFCKNDNFNVIAYDSDLPRFNRLENNVKFNGYSDKITCINEDFLTLKPTSYKYKETQIILCDPSCSGSGTFNNSLENTSLVNKCCLDLTSSAEDKKRLYNLSSFQMKIVKHAMQFTNVKLISYSTCSIYREENEDAVEQILSSEEGLNFELVDLRELVNMEEYHEGITETTKKCLRTCKKCFKMDGFFVALFKRKS